MTRSTRAEQTYPERPPVIDCPICSLSTILMSTRLPGASLGQLDSIVCTRRLVRRGETLFRAGDTFKSVYAVRVGCFKTIIFRDDREQVTGFHIAGEPLGLDGVYAGRQNCDAVALEDSQVCVIPYDLLENLCYDFKAVQQHVHHMMSGEIVRGAHLMMLLGTMTAEQRVATFLINLSSRMKARGYSAAEFNLRMTREEIGSYLGLKLETVSRMFSKLQRDGVIVMKGRQVKILDSGKLAEL
ncbi:Crp/Fnr family transcriptional regulator [Caballeronia sordidicola]|uniref:Crp/Fnr family transcriptional regulator n=1 Tax=Caballeronia sordidicola TaxID=196367 RepID=A0A158EMW8_CABSO|nr:Crp/Fnr family transcriptional regulator [Caballeronia sordidicola]